mmetsp:Transcript_88181/g.248963  ORF Transcript_88181/g.248963 Transcript_88181/m.248963 type:complete len:287 (+) Transcript_88181:601-1461(+)
MRAHAKVQRHQQHHSALQDLVRHASGVLATASREDAGPRTYVPRTICFRAVSVRYRLLEHEGHAQKVHHTKHAHEDERKGGMGHTLAWKPTDDERLRDNVGEKQPKHGLSDHSERIPNRRRDACVVQCRGPRIAGRRQVEAHVVECELDAALKACDEAADQQPRGGLLEQAVDHDAIPDDHEERLHLQGHAALLVRTLGDDGLPHDVVRGVDVRREVRHQFGQPLVEGQQLVECESAMGEGLHGALPPHICAYLVGRRAAPLLLCAPEPRLLRGLIIIGFTPKCTA